MLQYGATRNAYSVDQPFDQINGHMEDSAREWDNRKRLIDREIPVNRGCADISIGRLLLKLAGITDNAR